MNWRLITIMANPLVAYYRVSTQKQGQDGLGMEAQRAAVSSYANSLGASIAKSFPEVESGKSCDRPELAKAIAEAKRKKATLVIARLDRLARDVEFTARLMNSGVDFVCCDMPTANRLTIHILAAVAEDEARRISERTKAALKAYKAGGGKLGGDLPQCRNLTQSARIKGARQSALIARQSADNAYKDIVTEIKSMRDSGHTLQAIAAHLNEQGHTTQRGSNWRADQVLRVLRRSVASRTHQTQVTLRRLMDREHAIA
jgi:DNA invertase Pin-like site-specific DNA recombinase